MNNSSKIGGKNGKRLCFLAAGLLFLGMGRSVAGNGEAPFRLQDEIIGEVQEKAYETCIPVFSFMEEETRKEKDVPLAAGLFTGFLPLYEYMELHYVTPMQAESRYTVEQIIEGRESHEKDEEELELDEDLIEAIKKENERAGEEEPSDGQISEFQEADKVLTINKEELQDFDRLVSEFYAVDSTTYIGRDQLDVNKLMSWDMTLQQTDASKPQILIYHTHSQEGFVDSVPGDDNTTIMGAGEKLAQVLRDQYGFYVIHHLGKYDVESRDYAYSNSAPALEQILAENPEIEVIIDLHRDEVAADRKLVTEIDGRPTAKFMFFNGLSRTNKTGEIEYLQNPNLNENLAFSFQMQVASNEYYPGITRRIYLKGYRYNVHYRGKTLLIELGAQTNTVEEIMNAIDPLAHILSIVLSGEDDPVTAQDGEEAEVQDGEEAKTQSGEEAGTQNGEEAE